MHLTDSTSIITRDKVQILLVENSFAKTEISLFGAQVLSFIPKHDNRDRLWVSQRAIFDGKKPIRGGIPICWPWFGAHSNQADVAAHGYVRTQIWKIQLTEETASGTTITFMPKTSAGQGFTGKAQLTLIVHVGKQLSVQLHTSNLGETSFSFNCALHSYFAISDINETKLLGLSGQYLDKTRHNKVFETPHPYQFNEEIDRVHLHKPERLTINHGHIKTQIFSSGHDSVVIWNPWLDKSTTMEDMLEQSYLTMLCVETAVTQGQIVLPRATHILEQTID